MKHTLGSQKLMALRQHHDGSWRDFAEALGVANHPAPWRWANGSGLPNAKHRIAIAEATGGEIAFEDWEKEMKLS